MFQAGFVRVYLHDYISSDVRRHARCVSGRLEINVIRAPNYELPLPRGGPRLIFNAKLDDATRASCIFIFRCLDSLIFVRGYNAVCDFCDLKKKLSVQIIILLCVYFVCDTNAVEYYVKTQV